MHSHFFTLASLLLGSAVALNNLKVRQGDAPDEAFKPGSSSALGATCEDAWGAGFISCGTGNECYNPALGESCCQDTYACGTGSFCLTDGWCCPDGIDPETCAKNNDVPWPIVAAAAPPASSSSAAPSSADPTTPAAPDYTPAYSPAYSAPVYSSPAYPSPAPSYESHATTTYATSVGTITICPSSSSKTANGTIPTYAPTKPPAFTGAASPQNVAGSAVALIGFLGFLQNLL